MRIQLGQNQSGAVLSLLAAGLTAVLIGFLAFAIGIAKARSTQSRLQEIVDSAVQSGASSFCSTVACFDDAYEVALRSIENELIRSNLVSPTFVLPRNSGPHWNINGDILVDVERGYWWPTSVADADIPTGSLTLHTNDQFEPIDSPSGVATWQTANPMRPAHVLANAMYIRIRRKHIFDSLALLGMFEIQQDAEMYAVAGDVNGGQVCAAPFAVHICSLINSAGEFDANQASEYERFFTGVNRYCEVGDPDCDVIPGTLWTPVIDEERRNRRNSASSDRGNSTNVPDGVSPFPLRHSCSYEPLGSTRIHGDSLADQFGVVGLPGSAGSATESAVVSVLQEPADGTAAIYTPGGCSAVTIGSRFDILPDGLTEAATDEIVWSQINDTSEESYNHPEYIDTFLQYGVPTYKAQADTGWFYNNIPPNTRDRICEEYTAPRVGACNSRVVSVNRKCIEDVYDGLLGWGCSNLTFMAGIMNSEFVSACPPLVPDGAGGLQNDPSFYTAATGSFTGYDWKSYFNESLNGPNPGVARTSPKVWRIPISVVAPAQASSNTALYAEYCEGVNGNTNPDPAFDPALDYFVIGFVEALFFDTDVGQDSFDPIDLADICPPSVFDFHAEFAPWGFSGGEGATTNRCNMVKGMVNRKNGLLTGKYDDAQSLGRSTVSLIIP